MVTAHHSRLWSSPNRTKWSSTQPFLPEPASHFFIRFICASFIYNTFIFLCATVLALALDLTLIQLSHYANIYCMNMHPHALLTLSRPFLLSLL